MSLRSNLTHPSAELQALTSQMVELSLQNLWSGGVLVPVVGWCDSTGRVEHRVVGDHTRIDTDLNQCLQSARAIVDALNPDRVERYVWVYDGYAGRSHHESVVVEAAERQRSDAWLLAARYRLSKRGISLVDNELLELASIEVPFVS
jgi:hypothetical protein